MSLAASKSTALHESLQLLLLPVVRAIEEVRSCRFLSLSFDFVISPSADPTLLWMPSSSYLTGPEARDLEGSTRGTLDLAGAPTERTSWLPPNARGNPTTAGCV